MAHGLSCSTACGIFPDQGSNPCPCIGRRILNHCATREAPKLFFYRVFGSFLVSGEMGIRYFIRQETLRGQKLGLPSKGANCLR